MSKGSYSTLGSSLPDLEQAWQDRLKDAEALLAAGRTGWAIATGLYALEIRLKVLICRRLDLDQLPRPFEVHDLDSLLLLAGLSRRIERKPARGVKRSWDAIIELSQHLNTFRYTADERWATTAPVFFRQLRDSPHGVLPWLNRIR
jgi:hypothetical protein